MIKSEIAKPNTFLYFAYGSNLLSFRIHILNPTAEFVSIGRVDSSAGSGTQRLAQIAGGLDSLTGGLDSLTGGLDSLTGGLDSIKSAFNLCFVEQNYRVDFIRYSSFWGGPTGTLVATANAHTWGVIWRLHKDDMAHLDDQEGVPVRKYYVTYLPVHTPHIGDFTCRCYIQTINPLPRADNEEIPVERWPSWALKEIMIYGAKEHCLPDYYIKNLKRLKHNGEEGAIRTWCLLDRYAKDRPCECRVPGRIPRAPLRLDNKLKKDFRWTTEIIEDIKEDEA